MALQYVGGSTNSATGLTTQTISASLTALTGGIAGSAAAGDIVIVVASAASNNGSTPTVPSISTAGYTNLTSALFADGTSGNDSNMKVAYKVMGGTPDTSVSATASPNNASWTFTIMVHVWRGQDTVTPIDVTTTTATNNADGAPNPPSITPVTAGAVVLAIGACSFTNTTGPQNVTGAPSGYSNLVQQTGGAGGTTVRICAGIASKSWSGSGAEDPGPFSMTANSNGWTWCAATVALRPPSVANGNFLAFM